MLRLTRLLFRIRPHRAAWAVWALAVACAATLPGGLGAQQAGAPPALRFGLTTEAVYSSNRGLDAPSQGGTFEYIARLDFGVTFATPVQQLEISGDFGLRHVTGAERGTLDTGLVEPNLAIRYARQSRDAELSLALRSNELDVSSASLEEVLGVPVPVLVTEEGTRRTTVFDTELDLRRRAPFGITLSAGFTGLRYSNTTSPTLSDQDRFRLKALLRLDLTPSMRATLDLGYSTFEDFGTAQGLRETYTLNGNLRQDLRNGDASFSFRATMTEDGERYTIGAGRSITTALWEVSGSVGLTRDIAGDVLPDASLDLVRTLPADGSLAARFSRRVASGVDDDEEQITSLSVTYAKQLTPLTSFNTSLTFSETNPTAAGSNSSSVGTLGVGLERTLAQGLQLNLGFQHRVTENVAGTRARDNRLSVSLRRDLSARR